MQYNYQLSAASVAMYNAPNPALPMMTIESTCAHTACALYATVHNERIRELESKLAKTQETSQVLIDHVNSLEAQLTSRSNTERFWTLGLGSWSYIWVSYCRPE